MKNEFKNIIATNLSDNSLSQGLLSMGAKVRYFDIPQELDARQRENVTNGHTSEKLENFVSAVPKTTGRIPSVSMIMA